MVDDKESDEDNSVWTKEQIEKINEEALILLSNFKTKPQATE